MMSNWNIAFTTLIRQSRPAYWGNWGLDSAIKPGAVGTLDPNTGAFTMVDQLPNLRFAEIPTSSKWQVLSEHVRRSQSDVKLDGSGTAGVELKWGFDSAGMLASEFSVSNETQVLDLADQANAQIDWLKKRAASVGMASGSGISQGFGIVSSVIWATSGVNVGSQADATEFSVSGSVDAVNELVGAKAGLKGSYTSTSSNKSVEQRMWPAGPNAIAPSAIPIAYTFTSCHNSLFIPNWTRLIGAFELVLLNKPGCTYIVDADLRYNVPLAGEHQESAQVSGGLSRTFGNIPLTATGVTLDLTFKGVMSSDHKHFAWPTPLGQWIDGQRHIEMTGVWPWRTSALDRESGNTQ